MHACCGPCSIAPVLALREEGLAVTLLFVNPNIHPLCEYLRRREAMAQSATRLSISVIWRDDLWDLTEWLRQVAGTRDSGEARCAWCYTTRFAVTARTAAERGFDAFTSSLLYSRHQRHEVIIAAAEQAASQGDVAFLYRDFRLLWQQGMDMSRAFGVYRQTYCGCVYSESQRYAAKLKKLYS